MAEMKIYGQAYESPGDGGDVESYMELSQEDLDSIKSLLEDPDDGFDFLDLDDLPDDIRERMEETIEDEWSEGGKWHTFVCGFSISE